MVYISQRYKEKVNGMARKGKCIGARNGCVAGSDWINDLWKSGCFGMNLSQWKGKIRVGAIGIFWWLSKWRLWPSA